MFCIPIDKPEACEGCPACDTSDQWCSALGHMIDVYVTPPADCPIVEMPDVDDDTPPLDRALEAIEACYQNHPDDKLTAFLILRHTVEERINDIKDENAEDTKTTEVFKIVPDVEALQRKLAVYEDAFEIVASNTCPPDVVCTAHENDGRCEPCYRAYLEAKLKESETST